jgi:transcriptional/translational regulatory protein YebC/TACO1
MKALNETALAGAEAERMQTLLDALDELDDVQDVYTTAAI